MGINYDKPNDKMLQRLADAMVYHAKLAEADVTVQLLVASRYDGEGNLEPALKKNGLVIAAKTSVTSLPDRVRGIEDAKIIIDAASWESMADGRQIALLDHELEHLQLVYDSDGILKLDDRNRPKLKLKPHDFELNYFHDVAQRHGEASVEASLVRHFNVTYGEQLLLFGKGAKE